MSLWAWNRPAAELSDRRDRPWDDSSRQPLLADRRKALRRAMVEEEYERVAVPGVLNEKIRRLLDRVIRIYPSRVGCATLTHPAMGLLG